MFQGLGVGGIRRDKGRQAPVLYPKPPLLAVLKLREAWAVSSAEEDKCLLTAGWIFASSSWGGAQDQCKDPKRLQGGVAERPKPGAGLSTHTQPWGADASVRVGE